MLGYDSLGQRLLTFQLYDQQANVPLGIIPLLQVDMWEHAFYLQYKNVKADYVKAFWNVVNWADVQDRYAKATSQAPAGSSSAESNSFPQGPRALRHAGPFCMSLALHLLALVSSCVLAPPLPHPVRHDPQQCRSRS